MYQYQIYPTGNISNYRPIVNSSGGVSAILDRQMGILEYALSGLALYVVAINNYYNQVNVGLSGTPIISGFFNNIGFTDYSQSTAGGFPFITSSDGVISGVNNVYSYNINSYDATPAVQSVVASSGYSKETIFNTISTGSTIANFNFTGTLSNIYPWNTPTGISLYKIQQKISTPNTYPYSLDVLSGVVNNMVIRRVLNSSSIQYGFINDVLDLETLNVYNQTGVSVSGNVYVGGKYGINLSLYNTSNQWFNESLFNLNNHTHDGINSSRLSLSSFLSNKTVTDPFSIVLASGDLIVDNVYNGNEIGLQSNWERVDIPNLDNAQKLISFKNRLFVLDNSKLIDTTSNKIITTQTNYPRALVAATSNGDQLVLIENLSVKPSMYPSSVTNTPLVNPTGSINQLCITQFDNNLQYILNLPDQVIDYTTLAGTYYKYSLVGRKCIETDPGIRVNKDIYLSYIESFQDPYGGSGWINSNLALYAIDTVNHTFQTAGITCIGMDGTGDHGTGADQDDWKFLPPVKIKNSLFYIYKKYSNDTIASTGKYCYCAIHNTVIDYPFNYTVNINGSLTTYPQEDVPIGTWRFGFNVFYGFNNSFYDAGSTGLQYLDKYLNNWNSLQFSSTRIYNSGYVNAQPFGWYTIKNKCVSSIAYGNGLYVGVGMCQLQIDGSPTPVPQQYMYLYNSSDGINWNDTGLVLYAGQYDNSSSAYRLKIIFVNNKFTIFGYAGLNEYQILNSSDGITWTHATMAFSFTGSMSTSCGFLAYGNGKYIAIGLFDTNKIIQSSDAVNWVAGGGTDPANQLMHITFDNGIFLGLYNATDPNKIYRSVNGVDWTLTTINFNGATSSDVILYGLAYGKGMWLAVAKGAVKSYILSSTDNGLNWLVIYNSSATTALFETIQFVQSVSNGSFYIGCTYNAVYTTKNGIAVTDVSPNRVTSSSRQYYNSSFVGNILFMHNYVDPLTTPYSYSIGRRDLSSSTIFNGRAFVSVANAGGWSMIPYERNRVGFFNYPTTDTSIISYAGMLWTGKALEIGINKNQDMVTYSNLLNQLITITKNSRPWLVSPVIVDGWLYAIAPIIPYQSWSNATLGGYNMNIDNKLPAGSLIVRRRAAEVAFTEMTAYTL